MVDMVVVAVIAAAATAVVVTIIPSRSSSCHYHPYAKCTAATTIPMLPDSITSCLNREGRAVMNGREKLSNDDEENGQN